jgi:preprotein translocase subunit SecE
MDLERMHESQGVRMNRESKREMERQERMADETDRPRERADSPAKGRRTGVRVFLREVRGELKRVAWPSAKEVRSYSLVVLVTVTIVTLYVFALDWGFGRVVFQIFG